MALSVKIKRWLLWPIILIFGIFIVDLFLSGEMSREPLDSLWEDNMLAGISVRYADGQRRVTYIPEDSYETAKGRPYDAWLTKEGIAISDLREKSFLGISRLGGWVLHGGLLAKAMIGESSVELYGKNVVRAKPVPIFLFLVHLDRYHDYGSEFFLLRRKKGEEKATILKKWVFTRDDVLTHRFLLSTIADVRGFLQYEPGKTIATVKITGLKHPFEKMVDLSKVLEEKANRSNQS
jgi:hypothetical protein